MRVKSSDCFLFSRSAIAGVVIKYSSNTPNVKHCTHTQLQILFILKNSLSTNFENMCLTLTDTMPSCNRSLLVQ